MNFKSKSEFLNVEEIKKYINHLSHLIGGTAQFNHSYQIELKAWKKQHGDLWSCSSLLDAKNKYWWHGTFQENKEQLSFLTKGLKDAISVGTECDTLYWSMRVLEWGDVYKGCTGFILDSYSQNNLKSRIIDASNILDGEIGDCSRFNDQDLRMDSGLTKVYSLSSEQSIIFDSRVAAAMSLIAWRLFDVKELKEVNKLKVFAGGKATGNPVNRIKRSHVQGTRIFDQMLTPNNQARLNLLANWILNEAIHVASNKPQNDLYSKWEVSSKTELLRAIEASLFMIGSDISKG